MVDGMRSYYVPDLVDPIELPDSLTNEQAKAIIGRSMDFPVVLTAQTVSNPDGSVSFVRAGGTTKGN